MSDFKNRQEIVMRTLENLFELEKENQVSRTANKMKKARDIVDGQLESYAEWMSSENAD